LRYISNLNWSLWTLIKLMKKSQ